jgi:hypothetical protein
MADPVTALTVGSAVAGIGSTILGGMNQKQGFDTQAAAAAYQGKAQSDLYNYQAAVALLNKQIASQEADYARKAGEVQAQESDMATRARIGTAKAVQGASGLDVGGSTAQAVRSSIGEVGAENTAIVRANAARTAYGYEVTAASAEAQAGLDKMAATNSLIAGQYGVQAANIGGQGAILSTAGSVASKWMQVSQSGLFSTASPTGANTGATGTSADAGV